MSSKTFREYLYEQAFSKDVMLSKFTNNSDNIFNHVLKVLVYNDSLNNRKHLREMLGIVRSLQNKTIKSKITYPFISFKGMKVKEYSIRENSHLPIRLCSIGFDNICLIMSKCDETYTLTGFI